MTLLVKLAQALQLMNVTVAIQLIRSRQFVKQMEPVGVGVALTSSTIAMYANLAEVTAMDAHFKMITQLARVAQLLRFKQLPILATLPVLMDGVMLIEFVSSVTKLVMDAMEEMLPNV